MKIARRTLLSSLAATTIAPAHAQANNSKILRIGIGGLPTEKGNAFANIQTPSILLTGGVFDGLTRLTKDGEVEPWLATQWELLDPLTWRFTLRNDVVFSNGEPFNSDAVAFTCNYLAGSGPQTEGLRRDFHFLDKAIAITPTIVEIKTLTPVPMLPRYASVLLIVDPKAW